MSLLFAYLQFTLLQDFEYDVVELSLVPKSLGQVGCGGGLPFANIEEDGVDLQDIVKVGFDTRTIFQDFIFVACYLEAFLACKKYSCQLVPRKCHVSAHPPSYLS